MAELPRVVVVWGPEYARKRIVEIPPMDVVDEEPVGIVIEVCTIDYMGRDAWTTIPSEQGMIALLELAATLAASKDFAEMMARKVGG